MSVSESEASLGSVPPPGPEFEPGTRTWTLSRYADVRAGFQEPTLRIATPEGRDVDPSGDPENSRTLADLRSDIERINSSIWHQRMVRLARWLFNRAAQTNQPVDLVHEVIVPWSVSLAVIFGGTNRHARRRLRCIARRLVQGPECSDSAQPPEAELDGLVGDRRIRIGRSFFISSMETLPGFMAAAWLALLSHPDQLSLLRNEPRYMPTAVEEMLRYAGIVHTLYRCPMRDVEINGSPIGKGECVRLSVRSANQDPSRFEAAEEFDITRRPAGNLALGFGTHACPGAPIVRLSLSRITPVFLAANPVLSPLSQVHWKENSSLRWPGAFTVEVQRQPARS